MRTGCGLGAAWARAKTAYHRLPVGASSRPVTRRPAGLLAALVGVSTLAVGTLTNGATALPGLPALPAVPAAAPATTLPSPFGAGAPGGPPALLGEPSTTVARAKRTTTVPAPTTRPRQGLATPEAAARNLWDGWRDDDRPRSRLFATREAVEALFVRRWDPSMRDAGCTASVDGAPDRHLCIFRFVDGRAELRVEGDGARGYRVTDVALYRRDSPTTTLAPTTTTTVRPGKAKTGANANGTGSSKG